MTETKAEKVELADKAEVKEAIKGTVTRRPFLTTEFWVTIGTALLEAFKIVDFPLEAVGLIITWVAARIAQKMVIARAAMKTTAVLLLAVLAVSPAYAGAKEDLQACERERADLLIENRELTQRLADGEADSGSLEFLGIPFTFHGAIAMARPYDVAAVSPRLLAGIEFDFQPVWMRLEGRWNDVFSDVDVYETDGEIEVAFGFFR